MTIAHRTLGAQMVKNLPAMRETWVRSLGQEDPPEKGMATHSSILAWRIPWTEEPGELPSTGSQRVGLTERQTPHFSLSQDWRGETCREKKEERSGDLEKGLWQRTDGCRRVRRLPESVERSTEKEPGKQPPRCQGLGLGRVLSRQSRKPS